MSNIYLVSQQILPPSDTYKRISVEESLQLLETISVVGLDTETMGFDPYTKQLLMLQRIKIRNGVKERIYSLPRL